MASFNVPFVVANPDSWGPPTTVTTSDNANTNADNVTKYANLPYQPFGRSDRLGRVADFTRSNDSRGGRGGYGNNDYQNTFSQSGNRRYQSRYNNSNNRDGDENEQKEEVKESFQLIDTSKASATKRFVPPAAKRRMQSARLRQVNARRQQPGPQHSGFSMKDSLGRGGGRGGRGGGRGGRSGRGGRGGRGGRNYHNRVDRQPSVAVQPDWEKVEEIDLAKLIKNLGAMSDTIPTAEDILWCGFLDKYNDAYDKVTSRQPVPLKKMTHKEFYPVTTTDDPVLEKLAIDQMGQVFVTDTILAHLMTCTRSVYPWDLVFQKLPNGIIFIDKRDNSQLDYLTVYETSYNPPSPSEEGINSPKRLGLEATVVNQNFSQQVLKKNDRKEMDLPNPFFDEDDADGTEPASVAYRYRKFQLDGSTTLVCRTELHGIVKGSQYMTAYALNEYTPSGSTNSNNNNTAPDWRTKIDNQRGAVLANELKNNSFKIAKWVAQSLLAGADQMKVGFCSRSNPKDPNSHVILATQFYRPDSLAVQITLNESNLWALLRMFVQMIQKQTQFGKYVLVREPNKSVLIFYKVPDDTFEEEDEED